MGGIKFEFRIRNYELGMKIKIFIFFILIILNSLFITHSALAAKITFEDSSGPHKVGDMFTITIRLNTENQEINTIDLGILYPPLVEVKSVSKAGSAIKLWVQDPSFTNSAIFFTGGVPGGINSSNALISEAKTKSPFS